ncbi:DUF1707 and DUF4190 domain-containing protein [Dactylosporangium sp. NPDC050588]|uniref:DUF1707 and DUF4190 domain-containing protein n=1 Tax=Dactylosporangium sp. NPDC050588 TaxID=3157211 RepID=UPI0033C328DD
MNERVGNAQRTHVLDLLSNALQEGYLDLPEFEQRMSIVTAAKTADELMSQLADLPLQFRWDPRALSSPTVRVLPLPSAPSTAPGRDTRTTAIASLVLAIASIPLSVCFGMGGLFGIAAVVLSRPGLRSSNDHGKAMTGLVLGCVGIAASIVMVLLFIFMPTTPTTR